jgi:3'-phosphoadenosine 5'-phosphosulfate sulfotransferase (PAPS reductase)/FAD synthetase
MYKRRNIEHRVRQAIQIIKEFLRVCDKPYVSFSGGKDSTVVLHLVSLIDKSIPVVTQMDDLDFPHKKNHVDKIMELLGIQNHEYIGTPVSLWEAGGKSKYMDSVFSSVMENYQKQNKYSGHFMGVRMWESRARMENFKTRGEIYKRKDALVCTPIVRWRGEDVFAYIIQNDIPYIDVYDKDIFKMPHEIRFSWWYNTLFDTMGNVVHLKKNYPELFEKLIDRYPEKRGLL